MKRGLFFLFIFILILSLFSTLILTSSHVSALIINEVLYNPNDEQGSDSNGEWIELYTSEAVDLSGWVLKDRGSSNNSLSSFLEPDSYIIIVDNLTNFNKIWNCSSLVLEGSLGLSNSGDEIWLWNQSSLQDYLNYSDIAEEGESIQLINGSWQNKIPTPCLPNQIQGNQPNQTNETQPRILAIYPSEVWNNGTEFSVNLFLMNFTNTIYDLKIDVMDNMNPISNLWNTSSWLAQNRWFYNAFYLNSTNFSFKAKLKIDETFIGNASLKIKVQESNTSNLVESSYNISVLNGTGAGNSNNNSNDNNEEYDEDSSIKITDSPNKAKFGSTIKIDIEIYRGNTNKYAVYAYVEDKDEKKVSEKRTIHIDDKFSDYDDKIKIDLDCLNESGTYKIVLEGLDEKDTETINLESCEESSQYLNNTNTSYTALKTSSSQNSQNQANRITGSAIKDIEASSFSFMKILPYIFGVVILILIIYLVIKKF
jgi:hypothetical protein